MGCHSEYRNDPQHYEECHRCMGKKHRRKSFRAMGLSLNAFFVSAASLGLRYWEQRDRFPRQKFLVRKIERNAGVSFFGCEERRPTQICRLSDGDIPVLRAVPHSHGPYASRHLSTIPGVADRSPLVGRGDHDCEHGLRATRFRHLSVSDPARQLTPRSEPKA